MDQTAATGHRHANEATGMSGSRLLMLAAVTVGPILGAAVSIAFGHTVNGHDPAPYAICIGLIGLSYLIGANQAADCLRSGRARGDDGLSPSVVEIEFTNTSLRRSLAAAQAQVAQLSAQRDNLRLQIATDPLTGAHNRRGMETAFCTHGAGTVMALLDIDHFKAFNDELGHEVGDRVLKDFAGLLQSRLGEDVPLYRIGGEEFAIFFPAGQTQAVVSLLDQFRDDLAQGVLTRSTDGAAITFSAGLALRKDAGESFSDVYRRADARLYVAKQTGRDRTVWSDAALAAAA